MRTVNIMKLYQSFWVHYLIILKENL